MYIIAVKNVDNEIQEIARCETREQAQKIHTAVNFRYKFETYTYKDKISQWFTQFSSGTVLYNGIDTLNMSEYIYTYNEPKTHTVKDYENMIFMIQMQDHISTSDWKLIEKHKNEIKRLKGEI